MRKTIINGLCILALATLSTACSDDLGGGYGSGKGHIDLLVGLDNEAVGSRSEITGLDITAADLSVTLTKSDNSFMKTWEKLSDFSAEEAFTVGQYTIEAFYGNTDEQGFDKPAFYGSQSLRVADGETTSVAMTATLANSMVSITYTDAFRKYMQSWSAEVSTANGAVKFDGDETRPAYVTAGNTKVAVTFTKPSGKEATFEVASINAKPQYHYHVTVDVNSGNAGDATLNVTFNEDLETVTVDIDISDALLSSPEPELTAEGFDPAAPIEVISGLGSNAKPVMNLVALAGISNVELRTSSVCLAAEGWPETVELLNAPAATQQLLTGLGLNALGLWKNPGEMAVIDFSGVLSHMRTVSTDNTNRFTVVLKDKIGRTTEALTLTVNVAEVELELAADGLIFNPGHDLALPVLFNGDAETAKQIKIDYMSAAGTWRELPIVGISAPAGRASATYTITVTTPDIDTDLKVRAKCGTKVSATATIASAPFEVAGNDNDTYATYAYVTVAGRNGAPAPDMSVTKLQIKAHDEADFTDATATADGSFYKINGLKPATTYEVRLADGEIVSRAIRLTTEAAAQLANASFENTGKGSQHNEETIESWGTNNPMTTSQGGSNDYCRYSGTVANSAGRNGGKCVELRTHAWGSGNAIWISVNASTIKYFDAGLLHLGDSRHSRPAGYPNREGALTTDDLNPGIEFSSRPSSMSFWYKYSPKNSEDCGMAEFWVKDAAGNIIASGTKALPKADEFTQETISVTYPAGQTPKGAKLYVRFMSTGDSKFFAKTSDNFNFKVAGAMTGSKLYIDDVELNY